MRVEQIPSLEAKPWILQRHYAHRMPSVTYAFALYIGATQFGVVTYGMSPNFAECEAWKPWPVLELNRLCVSCEEKNASSVLVGSSLNMLKSIHHGVVISYADTEMGHVGYVYQATNWLYTGIGGEGHPIYRMKDGTTKHPRHETTIDKKAIDSIGKTKGKHRYYYYAGSKSEVKKMSKMMRFDILPYPKGATKRYDASAEIETQGVLF